jgi:hypothetical protein
VWQKIEYKNDDYNPYNYDPDPIMIIYRDDLSKEKEETFLNIINELSNKFYEPTTHYKHFNPELPRIKVSEVDEDIYADVIDIFDDLCSRYNFVEY